MPKITQQTIDSKVAKIRLKMDNYVDRLENDMRRSLVQRLKFASNNLRDLTKANISLPVRKLGRGMGVDPQTRSKPGEFPRSQRGVVPKDQYLVQSIFAEVDEKQLTFNVGTSLDYGLTLELKMDRSFLLRTLRENEDVIRRILTEKLPGY